MKNVQYISKNIKSPLTLLKQTTFLIILVVFSNILQAQKETRETMQHATLGEVTLVKMYKYYTDVLNFEYFEKNMIIKDPVFGDMTVTREYNKDGELTWETRIKKEYNDPTYGIVTIEQEFDEGELDTDYRIKKNYNDPKLGIVNVVMSFYEGELYQTFKYSDQVKEDAKLGAVNTRIIYDEDDIKDREVITYGSTTIEKKFYNDKLSSETKTYKDENNNHIQQELSYTKGSILTKSLTYKNGKKDGLEKHFYSDGGVKLALNYKNGEKIGSQTSYHSNGQLNKKETIDENGKRDGEYVLYKYDGSLTTKGSYSNGKKIGIWEEYGSHNPNLLKKCNYTEDNVTCEEIDYYDHGAYFTIKSITTLTEDQSGYYKNGAYAAYYNYEKKRIKEKGNYKDGKKLGAWITNDENGNTTCSITYLANGTISNQQFASYSDDGALLSKGSNVPYSSCGGKTSFSGEGYLDQYDDGKIKLQQKYFDGELVSEKMYKHGVLKLDTQFKNEEKIGLTAYDNEKRIKYTLKLHGNTTYIEQFNYDVKDLKINDKGIIIDKQTEPYTLERTVAYITGEHYAKGMVVLDTLQNSKKASELSDLIFLKTGLWKSYYKNGKLETSGKYFNDQPIGEWKSYYENGVLKVAGIYKLKDKPDLFGRFTSIKIGVWTSYDKNGKVAEEKDFGNGL